MDPRYMYGYGHFDHRFTRQPANSFSPGPAVPNHYGQDNNARYFYDPRAIRPVEPRDTGRREHQFRHHGVPSPPTQLNRHITPTFGAHPNRPPFAYSQQVPEGLSQHIQSRIPSSGPKHSEEDNFEASHEAQVPSPPRQLNQPTSGSKYNKREGPRAFLRQAVPSPPPQLNMKGTVPSFPASNSESSSDSLQDESRSHGVPSPPPLRQQVQIHNDPTFDSGSSNLSTPPPNTFSRPRPGPSPPSQVSVRGNAKGKDKDVFDFNHDNLLLLPRPPSNDSPEVPSSPLESNRNPYMGRNPAFLTASQSIYPRKNNGYLSPLDGAESTSGIDQRPGMKRWNSERIPSGRLVTPVRSAGRHGWSHTPTGSVALSDSTFKSSFLSSARALGGQVYQYRELNGMEVRLLKIYPERKTRIKCEVINVSLADPPPYVAISYAWGDAGNTRNIELEGSLVPIAVSLYGALEALRQKVDSVLVWVDALCINQQNRDERTQQVGLMTNIYSTAESVAVWLGPEEDDSELAITFLRDIAMNSASRAEFSSFMSSGNKYRDLAAVVSLFDRDYWRRLWVVQEIINARSIIVHCGSAKLPWSIHKAASHAFAEYRVELDNYIPGGRVDKRRHTFSPNQFSYSQVLVHQGPGSLPDLKTCIGIGEGSLLEVLRACRRKLTSDAKDKLFGILGILPEEVQRDFRADYSLSVKDIYTEVVEYLLKTTERVDVICDAIHFPLHIGSANLPSYVPDWSHIPQIAAIGHKYSFSAAGTTNAKCKFIDDHLNKLEMSAIFLDTIKLHGVAVGTLCTLGDYLMAFLHWRALLLGSLPNKEDTPRLLVEEHFCRTMSLGQVPPAYDNPGQWLTVCYHIFASLLRERLPELPLDQGLLDYVDKQVDMEPEAYRQFLQKQFGDRMMGRCFCCTESGLVGMGTGLVLPSDIVVVPLGCSTPVLLRLEGTRGEYRYIGDIYVDGYMHGRAVDQWKEGQRELKKYVLH